MYILIGLLGAWAYPTHCPSNVLTKLSERGEDPHFVGRIVTRVTAMLWSFFMIGWCVRWQHGCPCCHL